MANTYRKCAKCGVTNRSDSVKVFHRFPKPADQNILRATAWATYCWPEQKWSTVESLEDLFKKGKFLCQKHFQSSCYIRNEKTRLSKYAVPGAKEYKVKLLRTLRSRIPSMVKQISATREHNTPIAEPSNQPITTSTNQNMQSPGMLTYEKLEEDMVNLNNWKSIAKTTKESVSNETDHMASCELLPSHVSMTKSTSQDKTIINESSNVEMHEDPIALEDQDDLSMYQDEDLFSGKPVSDTDQCYACNECKETITGFRYTCVQCVDWDLCGACEARAAHAAHYLLRIPSSRPYKEIQAVLAVIRHQLFSEVLPEVTDSVIKSEPEEPAEAAGLAAEPDPLVCSDQDDCIIDMENIPKDSENWTRSGTSHYHSEQDILRATENSSNNTLRTLVHENCLYHHDYAKQNKNDNQQKLPNDNLSKLGLMKLPGAHHLTRGNIPTGMVTSQLPLRMRVIKKPIILKRPIVLRSPSGVKSTPYRADQATATTTEVSAPTSIPKLERATIATPRLCLQRPRDSTPAAIVKPLRSKVSVRLKNESLQASEE